MALEWIPFRFASLTSITVIMCIGVTEAGIGQLKKDANTVEMIVAIFRHGDRSPMELYRNDPHKNYHWPGGLGALTKKGALQHYNLGKHLREKYQQLLPEDGQYTQDDINVRSSEYERCIMSAQSLLAGFMPPMKSENLLPINWQPIPVISVPRALDNLISQMQPCKKYDTLVESLLKNPPDNLEKINEDNKELYLYLSKHSGQNITTFFDVGLLFNTLVIEKAAGLKLPVWTESVFPEKMQMFQERSYEMFTETSYMKKVKGGGLLADIYSKMVKKQKRDLNPDRKIFLFSGHDITLISVIRALNVTNQTTRLPDYASALVFELHRISDSDNDSEIKLFFYENSEANIPKQINIPGCENICTLTKFGETIKHLLFDNYDEICENPKSTELPSTLYK